MNRGFYLDKYRMYRSSNTHYICKISNCIIHTKVYKGKTLQEFDYPEELSK